MRFHCYLGAGVWLLCPVVLMGLLLGAPGESACANEKAESAANGTSGPDVFNPVRVWPVHVTLTAEEYAAIQPRATNRGFLGFGSAPKAPDPKRETHRNTFGMDLPWGTGAVTVGEETFAKVGIRYKGNGTIGDASRSIKKSLKIDLDRAGGTGRFGGSKTINLHCEVTDPSKCREILGYEVYRAAGAPAPRTALADVRLSVPGKYEKELLGLYTVVEEVDKPFLRDRFGTDKGLLMKPEGLQAFEDLGDDWAKYQKVYAPKRDATKDEAARLIAFARLVQKGDDATFQKEIGSYLDVDNYLRFLAATAFVANGDSFFALGHNYCLYLHPKTNKLHFIPWDLDRAFANFPILGSNSQQANLNLAHPYPGTHRLTERLLAIPGAAAQYQKLIKELSGTAFARERVLKQLSTFEAAVKERLERDAKAAAVRKEGASGAGLFGKPPELRAFCEKRAASVIAQVAGTSKGFVPTGGFGAGGPPKFGAFVAPPVMEALDKDGDEKLSRDEWLGGVRRLFDACAKDPDGKVDLKGLTAGLNKQVPAQPDDAARGGFDLGGLMGPAILKRADADRDGKLTSEELLAAAGAVFDEFDKGKGGKLDEDALGDLLGSLLPFAQAVPSKDKK